MPWNLLPIELKHLIFLRVRQDKDKTAPCASVCKEWQDYFEKRNFSRLQLTISRLAAFDRIAPRTKHHVQYIWLCIELQEYDCSQCRQKESQNWHDTDMETVKNALKSAFLTLSKWSPEGNLTLDITAYSPSDLRHQFQNARFWSDTVPTTEIAQALSNIHDPDHSWIHGKLKRRSLEAYQRFAAAIQIERQFLRALPKVPAVTTLLLRRQNRRRWDQKTLKEILGLLPNLEVLHYEPEREYFHFKQMIAEFKYWTLFDTLEKSRIRKLVLFEDFNHAYSNLYRPLDTAADQTLHPEVAESLIEATFGLDHFSAAFLIDAADFFDTANPCMVWRRLESLALTSHKLVPETSRPHIYDLLQKAAEVAIQMPKLKTLEIWNGGKGLACVFRYQAPQICNPAQIMWKGSWDLRLEEKAIHAWKAVAQSHVLPKYHSSCDVRVLTELLEKDVVLESHGDAVLALGLLHEVIRPVSLWQIRQEHKAN